MKQQSRLPRLGFVRFPQASRCQADQTGTGKNGQYWLPTSKSRKISVKERDWNRRNFVKAPKEIKSQLRRMGLVLDTPLSSYKQSKCLGFLFGFLPSIFWFPSHYSTSVFTVGPEKLPPTAEIQPRARKEIKGEWFPDVSRDSEECSLVSVRVYEVLRGTT